MQDLGEQIPDVIHPGEPAEHGDELAMLPLGNLEVDDVVVEVVLAVARRDRLQLGTGRVDEDRLQRPDFRSDVNRHTTNYSESCAGG